MQKKARSKSVQSTRCNYRQAPQESSPKKCPSSPGCSQSVSADGLPFHEPKAFHQINIKHQPQPSSINLNHHLSTSTIKHQTSSINLQSPITKHQPIRRQSPNINHQTSSIKHTAPIINHQDESTKHQASITNIDQSSVINHQASTTNHQPSSTSQSSHQSPHLFV